MIRRIKRAIRGLAIGLFATFAYVQSALAVELTMYYPVAVGGPLTKIVDGLVADLHRVGPLEQWHGGSLPAGSRR